MTPQNAQLPAQTSNRAKGSSLLSRFRWQKYSTRMALAFLRLLLMLHVAAVLGACKPKPIAPTEGDLPDVESIRPKAEGGDAAAQLSLGNIYAKGLNVTQSYTTAAKWYRLAADQGQASAQLALGELYEVGQGVPRNETNAAKWYRLAAEQGHAGAQYSLAALYVLGKGVPADDAEALKWYRLAAEQGDALSQYNLGMRYCEGRGVAPEPIQAYQWLSLAAAQGIADANPIRDALKRKMTREQISEGQRRVKEFAPKKAKPSAP